MGHISATSRGVEGLARRNPGNRPGPSGSGEVPTPAGLATWKMWGKSDRTSAPQKGGGFFVGGNATRGKDRMAIENLKCKECGATYDLGAHFACENCFGPLEVAYDHSGLDPAEAKRKIQAGSQGIWRYADFLPFEGRPGDPLEPGLTPLLRADRLAERIGLDAELWIKNDAANPTHSF